KPVQDRAGGVGAVGTDHQVAEGAHARGGHAERGADVRGIADTGGEHGRANRLRGGADRAARVQRPVQLGRLLLRRGGAHRDLPPVRCRPGRRWGGQTFHLSSPMRGWVLRLMSSSWTCLNSFGTSWEAVATSPRATYMRPRASTTTGLIG